MRHTSEQVVAFLTDIMTSQPMDKQMHVLTDNLSAHKTQLVTEFLQTHSQVHLHFTPTYSSWLNQVELWFAKIERDVIARLSVTTNQYTLSCYRPLVLQETRHRNVVIAISPTRRRGVQYWAPRSE